MDQRQLRRATEVLAEVLTLAHQDAVQRFVPQLLECCAELIVRRHSQRAALFGGAAEAMRERLGAPASPTERARQDRWILRLNPGGQVGVGRGDVWSKGRLLEASQVLEHARMTLTRPSATSARSSRGQPLSSRERDVAALLEAGFSNRAIANALSISEGTVRVHVERVRRKLGVRSRVQVAGAQAEAPMSKS
jgi:DNA-binding CsgD family transcriptional regulator